MLAELRRYFAGAGVLEVETPLACSSSGTDPALQPVCLTQTEIPQELLYHGLPVVYGAMHQPIPMLMQVSAMP